MNAMAPAGGRVMSSAAGGSWENYLMLNEHLCFTALFLSKFKW
jgi:hypothetical protein